MEKIAGIYAIRSQADGKVYIGSSRDTRKRIASHFNLLRSGKHHNLHLQNAFNKYGESNFSFEIIESVDPSLLLDKEEEWINALQVANKAVGYNISKSTRAPMLGITHTDEAKKKMSESHNGKKHSEESKRKISQTHLGVRKTKEHCESMSRVRIGKPLKESTINLLKEIRNSDSWKEKRSRLSKAQDYSRMLSKESKEKSAMARRQPFIVTNSQGESFRIVGLAKFCRENNLDQGSMTKVAQGKRNSCHGWTCQKITA